ncbi:MAG: hypothetical protein ACYTGQ_05435 [Planctomycetota bacterium]|jgi:T5SS/PEP-CTERM-associated repeat protein
MIERYRWMISVWPTRLAAAWIVALTWAPLVVAETFTWDGELGGQLQWDATQGTFLVDTNWTPEPDIPGALDDVFFDETASNFAVNLNGDRTVNSLTIGGHDFDGNTGYTFFNGDLILASHELTVNGGFVPGDDPSHTFLGRVEFAVGGRFEIGSSRTLVVEGGTSSPASVTKSGSGHLILGGHSTMGYLWVRESKLQMMEQGTIIVSGRTEVEPTDFSNIEFNDSTLSTEHLQAGQKELKGMGTIHTSGIVSDVDMIFDATHGRQQQLRIINELSEQDITIHLDQQSVYDLGVGYSSSGSMTIADGVTIGAKNGYLGYSSGSSGNAVVMGAGSTWEITGSLFVGHFGQGTLNIQDGGKVSNVAGYIGKNLNTGFNPSTSTTTVLGDGSEWIVTDQLTVGGVGQGELNVHDGGLVSSFNGVVGDFGSFSYSSLGVVNIMGENSQWQLADKLTVGQEGQGELNIEEGGRVSSAMGILGIGEHSVGMTKVAGVGSMWSNTGDLVVGDNGEGTLLIEAGGVVINATGYSGVKNKSESVVNVRGVGSAWINVVDLHIGGSSTNRNTLNIEDGGLVTNTDGFVRSGDWVSVTGNDSTWTNSNDLFLRGGSRLFIEEGGIVNVADTCEINPNTLNLVGGSLNVGSLRSINDGVILFDSGDLALTASDMHIGSGSALGDMFALKPLMNVSVQQNTVVGADGSLVIDGGVLTTSNVSILPGGQIDLVSGTLNLTDPTGNTLPTPNVEINKAATLNVTGPFNIPDGSTLFLEGALTADTLNVDPGASLIFTGGRFDAGVATNNGTVTTVAPAVDFGDNGLRNNHDLVLVNTTVTGPIHSPAGSAINVVGAVTFNDLVSGAGGVFGSGVATFVGGHSPGDSTAAVGIEGSAIYPAGAGLFIEIAGTTPGAQHDQINVAGALSLAGELHPTLIDGYVPGALHTFTIATFGELIGAFETTFYRHLPNDLLLVDDIQPNRYDLVAAIPGDFDLNGDVGVPDLIRWAQNFGAAGATFQLGDADLDTTVGVPDLIAWAQRFGQTAADYPGTPATPTTPPTISTLASATAIPEPDAFALLTLGALNLIRRRGRG